jgi:hypothetical protein
MSFEGNSNNIQDTALDILVSIMPHDHVRQMDTK